MNGLTLRQRALAALSRREYGRSELARKLFAFAKDRAELDELLNSLERENLLSSQRFSESIVHRRQERYGERRIAMELKEQGVPADVIVERVAELSLTEEARCRAVWQKKFAVLPDSAKERARQMRFLASRGFTGECIRRVLSSED